MKDVFVVLAFHAHEPLWDMPQTLLENIEDIDLKQTLASENWIVRRSAEGRDIYAALASFARRMGFPVALEATNELLVQLRKVMPETYADLRKAYAEGTLYPVYGHAHHTHISLLTDAEVEDEIRLNQEYLHDVMKAPRPHYAGLFPIEDSLDSSKLQGIKNIGIDFVIFPSLDHRQVRYEADAGLDEKHEPFLIGPDIIALPRHFSVSQHIWRPITRWKVEGVKNQGYNLGRYWVLPEEYRRKRFVRFPIGREEAVAEYSGVLRRALRQAPDGGLILYIQDLELMDFGDVALDIMEAAWKQVLPEGMARVQFVTPDQYLEKKGLPGRARLPRVKFNQISWAPEIRLVLRYDGHYPPRGAGKFKGIDLEREVFRKWPFIFWEPGRYLVDVCNWLMGYLGFPLALPVTAGALEELDYRVEELPGAARVALHSRIIKRACNWGWFPNEGLQKRPFLHAYCLTDLLASQIESLPLGQDFPPVPLNSFKGLERLPEVLLDTRHGFLARALVRLSLDSDNDYADASRELERSRYWRHDAQRSILKAAEHAVRAENMEGEARRGEMRKLLIELRNYCRSVFVSLDHIQRTWVKAGNTDLVLDTMYEYLYGLYPPKFPAILQSTLDVQAEA